MVVLFEEVCREFRSCVDKPSACVPEHEIAIHDFTKQQCIIRLFAQIRIVRLEILHAVHDFKGKLLW